MRQAIQKLEHAPTLNTIRMVEQTLQDSRNSIITVAGLKKQLPKQVNHNVLKTILEYLEESNKIVVSMKGITWVHNPNKKLAAAIRKGYNFPEDFS